MTDAQGPILAAELTKDDYAALVEQRRVFVLPFGILEEHGPHLPLGTDTFQVEAIVHEAAAATGAVVLPTVNYGNAVSTRPFPGTISIRFETLRALVRDILEEMVRHGVERVVMVSGHAGSGHMAAMKLGARDVLDAGHPLKVASLSEWDFLFGLDAEEAAKLDVPPGDGHAGTMETARMLDLRGELVGTAPGPNDTTEEPFVVSVAGMPKGYGGDPSKATAEKGRLLHQICVRELVALLERMAV